MDSNRCCCSAPERHCYRGSQPTAGTARATERPLHDAEELLLAARVPRQRRRGRARIPERIERRQDPRRVLDAAPRLLGEHPIEQRLDRLGDLRPHAAQPGRRIEDDPGEHPSQREEGDARRDDEEREAAQACSDAKAQRGGFLVADEPGRVSVRDADGYVLTFETGV